MSVTLAQASTIVDTALKKARDTISRRSPSRCSTPAAIWSRSSAEDKSGILRFDIAFGKAWGALGMGYGSRTLAERAPRRRSSSPCWRPRAAGASSPIRAAC